MALHSIMQDRAVMADWKPEMWISSQYCEYRPRQTIRMVLTTRETGCPLRWAKTNNSAHG